VVTLVLTRHGHTDRSEPEQYLGQRIDIALSERGRSDARRLQARLEGVRFDRVISSPLARARETAGILAPGATVELEPRLAEADYGDWEGLTREVLAERWPDLRRRWDADPGTVRPPGGESGRMVARRARSFLHDIAAWGADRASATTDRAESEEPCVLAVGHSTLNRVLLAVALDVPVRDYRRRFRQDWLNLTVLELDREGMALLLLGNDTSHLREATGRPWL
jgi:broad specificity phosphatase PhoE